MGLFVKYIVVSVVGRYYSIFSQAAYETPPKVFFGRTSNTVVTSQVEVSLLLQWFQEN